MKTMTNLLLFMMCIGVSAYAQDVEKAEPKGKAIVQVFGKKSG